MTAFRDGSSGTRLFLFLAAFLLTTVPAEAYIGPGAGVAFVSSFLVVLITLFLALFMHDPKEDGGGNDEFDDGEDDEFADDDELEEEFDEIEDDEDDDFEDDFEDDEDDNDNGLDDGEF